MPGVLYLVHGLPPEEYTGTPIVAHGYATGMIGRGWRTAVAYASPALLRDVPKGGSASDADADGDVARFPLPPSQSNGLIWATESAGRPDEDRASATDAFRAAMEQFEPDLVHVVDNVSLPLALPEVAADGGIPVVRTVSCAEDLCGLIVPVSPCSDPVGYCDAPISPGHCARCVAAVFDDRWGQPAGSEPGAGPEPQGTVRFVSSRALTSSLLEHRQARLLRGLESKRSRAERQFRDVFDVVVFSTPAWREYFEKTLPLGPDKARVISMGMDSAGFPTDRRRRRREDGSPLVLAWATTVDPARGADDVVEAFTDVRLATRPDYRLQVHGGGDHRLLDRLVGANPNVEIAGRYEAPALPALLAEADVGLSASLFETFHRVTREYLLAGLPVVANPTFGIRDLIRHGENGLLYEHARSGSLADAVVTLLDDPELEARLAEGARSTPVRTADEELDELAALYDEVLRRRG